MSGERNVSRSGRAQEAQTPPCDAQPRELGVFSDGDYHAVSQSDLAVFFKRQQGSSRARRLQQAASRKAALGEAIADRRALRRLEKQLREFDRSANPRRRMRAASKEAKARKRSGSFKVIITRLSKPLPAYPAPIIDRQGRQGVFLQIEYDSAKRNSFGVCARRVHYMFDESHAELVNGKMVSCSNMGETPDEIEAAADVLETANRAARKNAKLGFVAVCQLSPNLDQKGRVRALKRLAAGFDRRGVPYCMVLHAPSPEGDQRNFHIHVWFSHRPMERVGPYEWAVAEQLRSDLDGPEAMRELRREWAEILTQVSRAQGDRSVFTALSNAARGLANMPLRKLDRQKVERARRGEIVADVEANRQIIADNCSLAVKLGIQRRAPVRYRTASSAVPQIRPERATARPATPSVHTSATPIAERAPRAVATSLMLPLASRPQGQAEAPRSVIASTPDIPAVTTAAPGSASHPQPANLPPGTSIRPQTKTGSPQVGPVKPESLTTLSVSPRHPLRITVTPALAIPRINPVTQTHSRRVIPQSLHILPSSLWMPVTPDGLQPNPVTRTVSSTALVLAPPVLSRSAIVKPVDAVIGPYSEWDDGGAERWLIGQGIDAEAATGLIRKVRTLAALPTSEVAVPNPLMPVTQEALPGRSQRSIEASAVQSAPATTGDKQPSVLDRLEKLGRSLQTARVSGDLSAKSPTQGNARPQPTQAELPPVSGAVSQRSPARSSQDVRGRTEPQSDGRPIESANPQQVGNPAKDEGRRSPTSLMQEQIDASRQLARSNYPEWTRLARAKLTPLFMETPLLEAWWERLIGNEKAECKLLAHAIVNEPGILQRVAALEPLVAVMLRGLGRKSVQFDGPIRQAPEAPAVIPAPAETVPPGGVQGPPGPTAQEMGGRSASSPANAMSSPDGLSWTSTGHELVDRWHAERMRGQDASAQKLADEIVRNKETRRVFDQLGEAWRRMITEDAHAYRNRRLRQRTRTRPGAPPPSRER